jgi:uncharacterized protein
LLLFALTGTGRNTTGCGVEEQRNYDLVAGKILACADLGMDWTMGVVDESGHPHLDAFAFDSLIAYKDPLGCYACGVHAYCGGRCPIEALNSDNLRLIQYCQLMRLHVGTVLNYLPQIKCLLDEQKISLQTLYDESALLTQFTDVTP